MPSRPEREDREARYWGLVEFELQIEDWRSSYGCKRVPKDLVKHVFRKLGEPKNFNATQESMGAVFALIRATRPDLVNSGGDVPIGAIGKFILLFASLLIILVVIALVGRPAKDNSQITHPTKQPRSAEKPVPIMQAESTAEPPQQPIKPEISPRRITIPNPPKIEPVESDSASETWKPRVKASVRIDAQNLIVKNAGGGNWPTLTLTLVTAGDDEYTNSLPALASSESLPLALTNFVDHAGRRANPGWKFKKVSIGGGGYQTGAYGL